MPLIRYTFSIEGDVMTESDYFERTESPQKTIEETIIQPMAKRRLALGEPLPVLVKVEVINPHVHKHTWRISRRDSFACKAHYYCEHCSVNAYRRYLPFAKQEVGGMTFIEPHNKDKFLMCKDPLKELPKKINF